MTHLGPRSVDGMGYSRCPTHSSFYFSKFIYIFILKHILCYEHILLRFLFENSFRFIVKLQRR